MRPDEEHKKSIETKGVKSKNETPKEQTVETKPEKTKAAVQAKSNDMAREPAGLSDNDKYLKDQENQGDQRDQRKIDKGVRGRKFVDDVAYMEELKNRPRVLVPAPERAQRKDNQKLENANKGTSLTCREAVRANLRRLGHIEDSSVDAGSRAKNKDPESRAKSTKRGLSVPAAGSNDACESEPKRRQKKADKSTEPKKTGKAKSDSATKGDGNEHVQATAASGDKEDAAKPPAAKRSTRAKRQRDVKESIESMAPEPSAEKKSRSTKKPKAAKEEDANGAGNPPVPEAKQGRKRAADKSEKSDPDAVPLASNGLQQAMFKFVEEQKAVLREAHPEKSKTEIRKMALEMLEPQPTSFLCKTVHCFVFVLSSQVEGEPRATPCGQQARCSSVETS